MLEWFICPDKVTIPVPECLDECRLGDRCLTKPYLLRVSQERVWAGKPSTTQLLNGTMYEFLKLTQPYAVDPDNRAFMVQGTLHHESLEEMAELLNLPSEVALSVDRDIFDLLEPEDDGWVLTDYKLWGSYRVAKALGIYEAGKMRDPSGAVYKVSGKWGKAGDPKMVPVFDRDIKLADLWETELQLNNYRIKLEDIGLNIVRMQVQATVRDGGLAVASGRGLDRNVYKMSIARLDDTQVLRYFMEKELKLLFALEQGKWTEPCNDKECWEGVRCRGYCEVALFCPKGVLYK